MKKERFIVILAFLSLIFIPFASAVTINMRESYSPGETIIAEISGNILEQLNADNAKVKRVNVEVPVEYDLKKLGERYYLWAIAPNVPANYTLIIKDIFTTISGNPQQVNLTSNFYVSGNFTDYSVKPGFVISKEDFVLNVQLNEDKEKIISIDFPDRREIALKPGNNRISFQIKEFADNKSTNINVGKYVVPVYLTETGTSVIVPRGIAFYPEIIEREITEGESSQNYQIGIKSFENTEIKGIYLEYDSNKFSVNPNSNLTITPNQTTYVNLSVKNLSIGEIYDEVYARSASSSALLVVKINVVKKFESPITNNNSNNKTAYRCSEISNGRFCSGTESCSGNSVIALDGNCCVGTCIAKPTASSSWIAYIIGLILILIVGVVYLRYYKTKAEKNPLQKQINKIEKKIP